MTTSKQSTIVIFFLFFYHLPVSTHPSHGSMNSDTVERIEILMPGVAPQEESHLCRSVKINKTTNIIGFEPRAKMPTVHHLLIYGCKEPGTKDDVWSCAEMMNHDHGSHGHHHQHHQQEPILKSGSVCMNSGDELILYAWAKDAPAFMLPSGVGFRVGPGTKVMYLVMQMHYGNVSSFLPPNNNKDHSGVVFLTKNKDQPKQAGNFLLLTSGIIPSHSTTYLEAACQFRQPLVIHPFAYRVHTHKHGKVVAGYRVRGDEWTEIGRKDPQLPHMFYNVTNPGITITPGDILASRCTMVNEGDDDIEIGNASENEMCNFYFMYYVEGNNTLTNKVCFTAGYPLFRFTNYFDPKTVNNIPKDASVVPGTSTVLEESGESYEDSKLYEPKADSRYEDNDDVNYMNRMKNSDPINVNSVRRDYDYDGNKYGYKSYDYSEKADYDYDDKKMAADMLKELALNY